MKLTCPVCGSLLNRQNKSAVCKSGHSFDFAKQGYLNLLLKQSIDHGDNKEMVTARTNFLNTGSYAFLRDAIGKEITSEPCSVLADLGCGEGYYTQTFAVAEKYGFDMSKDALKHASRTDHSTQYAVASIFRLPLEAESMDVCVTCFAPFAKDEIQRVLKHNGRFIFVSPAPIHLYEMKAMIYDNPYENVVEDLETDLIKEKEYTITQKFTVDQDGLQALFKMTPYVHRTKKEDMEKINNTKSMEITASFVIRTYRKK